MIHNRHATRWSLTVTLSHTSLHCIIPLTYGHPSRYPVFVASLPFATLAHTMLCCTWIRMLAANSYDRQVTEAARIVAEGGVVAFPTDTVYGLGADARNETAIQRVFDIKGRPSDAPLPLLLSDISQVPSVARDLVSAARDLAERFWPGALTLVVPAIPPFSAALVQDGFVGLRIPNDPFCLRLIERFGGPITGTSANLTGATPCMTGDDVRKQLGKKVDYILDAGRAGGGLPSTVVKVTEEGIIILREGAIPGNVIQAALDERASAPSPKE